jgi:hypothetical protein
MVALTKIKDPPPPSFLLYFSNQLALPSAAEFSSVSKMTLMEF